MFKPALQRDRILRFTTEDGACHMYQDHLVSMSNSEIKQILIPHHFSSYPCLSLQDVSDIFEHDRKILLDALLLIHIWFHLRSEDCQYILSTSYETYWEFFFETLTFIQYQETDPDTISLAQEILSVLEDRRSYLGPYHGWYQDAFSSTRECLAWLGLFFFSMYYL
jgi:hypothetical protein